MLISNIFFNNAILAVGAVSASSNHQSFHSPTLTRRSISNGISFRILPIGDSITWGHLSSDGNGYRLPLLTLLSGNPVEYIGTQHSGNMTNNNTEGYPGATIDQIASYVSANGSLAQQPNLVLLMAGTNDINLDQNSTTAPARLGKLIDEVINACPNTTVLVAEITPIWGDPETRVEIFNAALPGIVAERVKAGSHVLTVNMSAYLSADDMGDGLHPNDGGYVKMADAWFAGIQEVAGKGWIETPVSTGLPSKPVNTDTPSWASRGRGDVVWIGRFVGVFWLVLGLCWRDGSEIKILEWAEMKNMEDNLKIRVRWELLDQSEDIKTSSRGMVPT